MKMLTILILASSVVVGFAAPDFDQCISSAEAIFTTSFDPSRKPPLQIEKVIFQATSGLGTMALHQGASTLLNQFAARSSTRIFYLRKDIVFSRMPRGDAFSGGGYAELFTFQLEDDTFSILGTTFSIADVQTRLIDKK